MLTIEPPFAAVAHQPCRLLCHQEAALEIGVHHPVPGVLVDIRNDAVAETPALLTRMSSPPRASAASATALVTDPASVTSSLTTTAVPPASVMAPRTSSRLSVRRAASATLAPDWASVSRRNGGRGRWRRRSPATFGRKD